MAKYLVSTVETYRVDSEEEVQAMIDSAKSASEYELVKYSSEHKDVKQKGEIIDSYEKLVLTKSFCDIKDPWGEVSVTYSNGGF